MGYINIKLSLLFYLVYIIHYTEVGKLLSNVFITSIHIRNILYLTKNPIIDFIRRHSLSVDY
jgi:hypothetical protein